MREASSIKAEDVVELVRAWSDSVSTEAPTSGVLADLAAWRASLPNSNGPSVNPAKLCPHSSYPD
jgi:hypothetical protein